MPPFPPATELQFPHDPADIEIHFKGLLLLIPEQADQKTYCSVGVLQAPQHNWKIEVEDADTGATLTHGIRTPVQIHSTDSGVLKYVSTTTSFPGNHNSNEMDFRWGVDLKALHPGSSLKGNAELYRAVTLKDGLLFTAVLTNPEEHAVHLLNPSRVPKCWNRIAAWIGCRITLGTGEKLTFTWNEGGVDKTFELPQQAGQRYLVRITNLPPRNASTHDDLQHYYTYAIDTHGDPPYRLNFYGKIGGGGGSGVDAPCMAGSQDGDGRPY